MALVVAVAAYASFPSLRLVRVPRRPTRLLWPLLAPGDGLDPSCGVLDAGSKDGREIGPSSSGFSRRSAVETRGGRARGSARREISHWSGTT